MTTDPATSPAETAAETAAEPPRQRPQLEVCLDQYLQTGEQLKAVSAQYQRAKQTLLMTRAEPNAPEAAATGIHLVIGGVDVPVPRPSDPAVFLALLEDAVVALGKEVINLWEVAHGVTTSAVAHCQGAQAAVQTPPAT